MDIKEEVQKRIEKLTPKPKWQFILIDIILFTFFIISIITGGIFFSHMIFYFVYNSIFPAFFYKPIMLIEFPHVWILAFISFILLSNYILKYTKRGYKYNFKTIVLINIALTIIVGGIMYNRQVTFRNCQKFINTPVYNLCINKNIWQKPDQGFIKGTVIQTKPGMLQIKDSSNNIWVINSMQNLNIDENNHVRIIGEKINPDVFEAKRIFPYVDVRN